MVTINEPLAVLKTSNSAEGNQSFPAENPISEELLEPIGTEKPVNDSKEDIEVLKNRFINVIKFIKYTYIYFRI